MNSVPVLSSSPTPRGFSDIPLTRRLTMADLCTDAGQSNTLHSPAEDSLRTAASSKRHHVAEEGSEAGPLAKRLCDEASAVEAKQNTLEQAKANKRPNFLGSNEIVMFKVADTDAGDNEAAKMKSFPVHKSFICHYSPYFDTLLNCNSEPEIDSVAFEADPLVFNLFLEWIYTQKLPRMDDNAVDDNSYLLAHLWILAEKCEIPALQNQVIKRLSILYRSQPNIDAAIFDIVYRSTGPNSPLRGFFVEFLTANFQLYMFPSHDAMPHEMLADIIRALQSGLPEGTTVAKRMREEFYL